VVTSSGTAWSRGSRAARSMASHRRLPCAAAPRLGVPARRRTAR
jgi:hypothetical protein